MRVCIHCGASVGPRCWVCIDCAAHVRRAKERRRQAAPLDHEPSRIRLPLGATVEERFWVKVEKTSSCWIWTGSRNGRGYGLFGASSGGAPVRAHRFSYELRFGPIPEGMQLDHLCEVKACVNPDHLEPVTNEENSRRARARAEA